MVMFAAFIVGLVFGLGLIISQMVNPAKVLSFLDIADQWDPSLALVMASAVAGSALGTLIAKRRSSPVFARTFDWPRRSSVEARLLGGSVLFGLGWGLVGLCPGPALTGLSTGAWQIWVFVVAMLAGMILVRSMETTGFQREPSEGDAQ